MIDNLLLPTLNGDSTTIDIDPHQRQSLLMMDVLVSILAIIMAAQAQAAPDPGRGMFYKALTEGREGENERAVELLGQLVKQFPDDSFADDALAEQARLYEEALGKPGKALELYRLLIERYPNSRLIRRAKSRAGFLAKHLDAGDAVLTDYLRIQRESEHEPAGESIGRMRRLLDQHPDFSLRPDGLYWVATLLAREGRKDEAGKCLLQIAHDYPEHRMAGRALIELANLEIGRGNLGAADQAFDDLGRLQGENWKSAMEEGRLRLAHLRRIRWVEIASALTWLLAVIWLWSALALRLRAGSIAPRQLLVPPIEVIVYLIVMAGLTIWAASGTRQATHALLWMGGMFTLLLLPNGWLMRAESMRPGALAIRLGVLSLAGCTAVVTSVWLAGMIDQVVHTLQFGIAG